MGAARKLRSGQRKPKGNPIRTPFKRPARAPVWIAGISICLLAVSGIVAVYRSIPASYASIPGEGALFTPGAASSGSEDLKALDLQANSELALPATNHRPRSGCPECGVIESMRQIEQSGGYEFTVRFRNGSTTVFNEASERNWRLGNRVIVIGGLNATKF